MLTPLCKGGFSSVSASEPVCGAVRSALEETTCVALSCPAGQIHPQLQSEYSLLDTGRWSFLKTVQGEAGPESMSLSVVLVHRELENRLW